VTGRSSGRLPLVGTHLATFGPGAQSRCLVRCWPFRAFRVARSFPPAAAVSPAGALLPASPEDVSGGAAWLPAPLEEVAAVLVGAWALLPEAAEAALLPAAEAAAVLLPVGVLLVGWSWSSELRCSGICGWKGWRCQSGQHEGLEVPQ
jgi:hypothetical protein